MCSSDLFYRTAGRLLEGEFAFLEQGLLDVHGFAAGPEGARPAHEDAELARV